MKQIKYSYCIDENDNLIHINTLTNETRHAHKWRCLQCGQEMVANLGTKKVWYFSHKADTACDGESYLHKLAKRRIREKFLSSDSFPITFVRNVPCEQHKECQFFDNSKCEVKNEPIRFDLKEWYDTCQEEVNVERFRPDLLLICSTKPDIPPIFIEIYVTHQSEEAKINSGKRIIETKQINSENDIKDIINNEFVEGKNCITINFNPDLPQKRKDDVLITRFVLFKNGKIRIYKYICGDKLNKRIERDSIYELNINEFTSNNLWKACELGILYLLKKGFKIRGCFLCKYGKYIEKYKYSTHICTCNERKTIQDCTHYEEIVPTINDYPLSELENIISEVPS